MALKEILVEWECFNFQCHVVVGPRRLLPAYIKKRLKCVYKHEKDADINGLYFPHQPQRGAVLWIPRVPQTPKDYAVLAHEMTHCALDLHSQRAIKVDQDNDEPLAYLVEHGVRSVLEAL